MFEKESQKIVYERLERVGTGSFSDVTLNGIAYALYVNEMGMPSNTMLIKFSNVPTEEYSRLAYLLLEKVPVQDGYEALITRSSAEQVRENLANISDLRPYL